MLSGNFICAGAERCSFDRHVPAPYFRRSFLLSKKQPAQVTVCGLGFYELWINGARITRGRLAPYISNTDDMVYYDKYDLTPYVREGENVIGLLLGNGLQNNVGGGEWRLDRAPFTSQPKLALHFSADELRFEADSRFLTAPSPILFDDYRCGEFYDARLERPGWNQPGYDPSGWKPAVPCPAPKGKKAYCTAEPIRCFAERKPVSIRQQGDGFLYDFGQNDAGLCRLTIRGTPGQEVTLRHGEILKDGQFYNDNLLFQPPAYRQTDRYTCKGGAEEQYTPFFTYHGFRYVLVTGITPQQASDKLLTFLPMHSDLKAAGSFTCSDPVINRIQELCVRSTLSNFFYFPNDCPQREKNGWTADAALSCEQTLMNFAAEKSLSVWMQNVCRAQNEQGALPGIVPTGGWGFDWGNGPAWDCVITTIPYLVNRYTGDRRIMADAAGTVLKYLQYLDSRKDENGLLAIGLGDWCPPDRKPDDFPTPLVVTDSIMAMDIAKKAAYLFAHTGRGEAKKYALDFAARMRESIRRHLIRGASVRGETQTAQAMALYYGCFEREEEPAALERLVDLIREADDHFDTGVVGARVLYETLSRFGRSDLALRLIKGPGFPSYGYLVESGDTTLREMFLRRRSDIESFNHHFWSFVSGWFYRWLGGIKLPENEISPVFPDGMDFVKCKSRGVSVCWRREKEQITIHLTLPKAMTVKLPGAPTQKLPAGSHELTVKKRSS